MCLEADFTDVKVFKTERTMYKVVRKHGSHYESQYPPYRRSYVAGHLAEGAWPDFGTTKHYMVGKETTSYFSESLGLHCFSSLAAAKAFRDHKSYKILKVTVPSGTKYVQGYTQPWPKGYGKYCAYAVERLIPTEEVNLNETA